MYETITTNMMVKNVKDTIEFYRNILGFEVVLTVPSEGNDLNFAMLSKDSISIMLQSQQSLIQEYPTLETNAVKPTFTLFITVKDVEGLYRELKDKVKIAKEIHQTFYGKMEFAFFDHNDYILTISC